MKGAAYLWLGTNLQYPSAVQEIQFNWCQVLHRQSSLKPDFGAETDSLRLVHALR